MPQLADELAGFTFDDPATAARVGHQLIDELETITERYPDAADARDRTNGDIDTFLAVADLNESVYPDQVVSKRIRWVDAALEAWIELMVETGMASHSEIQSALNRIHIDKRSDG